MVNKQNLEPPWSKDNPEVARENQKKSVAARKRNRAKKKTIAETVDSVLNMPVTDPKQLEKIRKSGMPVPKNPTYRDYIVANTILKSAKRGFVDDLTKIMAIVGETPIQEDSAALKRAKEILGDIESVIE